MDKYYDTIAPSYVRLHKEEQNLKLDLIDLELRRLKISIGKRLLDVGCGTGISTTFFQEKFGCNCTGIDPSQGLLDRALPGPKYLKASAEKIPFPDNSFDIVISITAIQNFHSIDEGLKEMERVLRSGLMIISFLKSSPNSSRISSSLKRFEIISEIEQSKDMIYFLKI